MFLAIVELVLGVAFLVGSAELLVHQSISLSRHLGIKPIIIGLTVVAFGTSAPELFVTLMANLKGNVDLAVGNIIGSNIANIGLILGISALVRPFGVPERIVRVELPFLIISVILIGLAAWMHILGRIFAAILLSCFFIYLFVLVKNNALYGTSEDKNDVSVQKISAGHVIFKLILIIGSFLGLVFGSKFLIKGAVEIARFFNCPELIIGLSLTAVGTSLPELASSLSAVRRGEAGLIIGNVLGSNFANTCGILGISGLIKPIIINPHVFFADFPVMAGFSIMLVPIFKDKFLSRNEGLFLLLVYLCYVFLIYFK